MAQPDFNTNGSVSGVIGGIMKLARQHTLNQQHDEAFKTEQVKSNMDNSVSDIMHQMALNQVAQPVQNGKVNEPTTSYTGPSAVPGAPDIQTGVPGGPTPVAPDRQMVTYNSPGGRLQYAMNSPERNAQLADTAAARARSNKALDEQAIETAKQNAFNEGHLRANELQLQAEGGGIPAPAEFSEFGIPAGSKLTRAQVQAGYEQLSKLREQQANTRKTNASAQEVETQNSFLQNLKPQDIHASVDQIIPSTDLRSAALNKRTHAAVNTALLMGDKKGALAALKDAGDQLGRTETAVATANATQGDKIQLLNVGQDFQKTEAARKQYVESAGTMHQAEGAGKTLLAVLDLADQGNSAAAGQLKAMLPELTNSVQGIKRLGAGQGDQSLGNAGDKILGLIGGITEGQPIDKNVRDQIRQLVPILSSGAVNAHNFNVRTLNGTYGSNFSEAPLPQGTTGGAPKPGDMKAYQGANYKFDGKQWVRQ